MIYLQNKVTGEIKDVEPNSQLFRDLIAERTPDNKPVWEQTSDAAVARKVESAEAGVVRETDLPKDSQLVPQKNLVEDFSAEVAPWKNLTDAEVDLGLTPEVKAEHEQATLDTAAQVANAQTTTDAAAKIAASDTQRRGGSAVAPDLSTGVEPDEKGEVPDVEPDEKGEVPDVEPDGEPGVGSEGGV